MDDFFQIIIWLFIIISFLSGLFKKRDKSGQPTGRKQQKPDRQVRPSTKYSQTEEGQYDILREIEGLFKPDAPPPILSDKSKEMDRKGEVSRTSSEHISTEGTRRESEYKSYETIKTQTDKLSYRSKAEHDVTSSEHIFSDYQSKKKVRVDPKVAEQALRFERMLAEKKKENQFIHEFRRKINHPESLREYILFSEIIGKPKALRR